jgi:HD-GYP domain-containing protein (c-di-GMP phosphodiesterase class II)
LPLAKTNQVHQPEYPQWKTFVENFTASRIMPGKVDRRLTSRSTESTIVGQLLEVGQALSGSHDLAKLLEMILTSSRHITCSDAGSVYLVDRSQSAAELVFKVAQNDSLPITSFQESRISLTTQSLAGYVASTGLSLNIADAYDLDPALPYRIDPSFDRDFGYRTVSVLVLPMTNQEGETIGVLQLINRKQQPDTRITQTNAISVTQRYSSWEEQIITALASQAAISIERNHLQESIENLFAGFIRAAVQVIESRDPPTAGHSERVADLTVGLAQATHNVGSGSLGSIFFTDRQIQEIRYASLLHDFGKVGVPEAILGKERKLYPAQLQSIEQRLSILQSQWQLSCAQAKFQIGIPHQASNDCPHCHHQQRLDVELQSKLDRLYQHWELVKKLDDPQVNFVPGLLDSIESISHDLQELSQWQYTDLQGHSQPILTAAEIEQLMIPRGSLTLAERKQIEAHVVHTYDFLKQIPWTKHLQNVPEIAGAHHEKLNGSGYPRGLKAAEIPIQSQMMAIADIYDALTANDRPYKPKFSIDRSLSILRQEAESHKINADLLDLFEQQQVYRVVGHSL